MAANHETKVQVLTGIDSSEPVIQNVTHKSGECTLNNVLKYRDTLNHYFPFGVPILKHFRV